MINYFKKPFFKFFTFLIVLAVILEMTAGPVLAAAPQITEVAVSANSAKITFDQEVVSDVATAGPSSSAGYLGNYTLESPTGASQILSRLDPYNQWTEYNNQTLKIFGLNLTQGQSWQMQVQNIQNTTSTPETMDVYNDSGAVIASIDPLINNVTPLFAKAGDAITISGLRFGDVQGTGEILIADTSAAVSAWSDTSITATVPALSALTDLKTAQVINSDGDSSQFRQIAVYDANFGILRGAIVDTDGATAVDRVLVEAYQTDVPWIRYQGYTQANGLFALTVPAGTYTIIYNTPGSGSTGAAPLKSTDQIVAANSSTNVGTITFLTKVIYGTIYAPNGTTAAFGARVKARNQSWTIEQDAYTGRDGSYKIYVTASSTAPQYVIEVEPSYYDANVNNYLSATSTIDVATSGVSYLKNINLATENVIGSVKTPAGDVSDSNPYPNTAVPRVNAHIFNSAWTVDRWTQTDDSGNFKFGGIANGTYTVEIEPPYCGDGDANVAKFCVYSRTRLSDITVGPGASGYNAGTGQTDLGVLRFSAPNFFGYVYADANSNGDYDFTDTNVNNKCDAGETGEGKSNSWVNMSKEGFWTGGQTDACGRYSFYLPGTGRYWINVQPPAGFAAYSDEIDVSVLPITSAYNIALTTPNVVGYIYGPLSSADAAVGQPWSWLELCPNGAPGQCYGGSSDQSGYFSLNAPNGTWQLSVNANWGSYYTAPSPKTVVIANNILSTVEGDANDSDEPFKDNNQVIIRLVDPANDPTGFSGIVYGPTGLTPDVSVAVQPNIGIGVREAVQEGSSCRGDGMSRWTQTNAQGRFALSGLSAGLYEVEATTWGQSNYARARVCHTITAESATRALNINLTSKNITGTIATPAGDISDENPTPDIAVGYAWVSLYSEGSGWTGGGWYGASTDENGAFGFGGVAPGIYTLEAQAGWGSVYSSRRYTNITLADDNSDGIADTANLNILIGAVSTAFPNKAIRVATPNLKGRIMSPGADGDPATTVDNQPMQWVWVMAHDSTWQNNTGGNTDDNGYFRIGGLSAGNYQLEVNLPWGGSQALVAPTNLTVAIDANGVGVISGSNVANNVITLAVPVKTISGLVYKDSDNDSVKDDGESAVANAMVSAHRDMGGGYFETRSAVDGAYTLKVSQGSWWIETRPSWDGTDPDWVYTDPPNRIAFALADDVVESQTLNFAVSPTNSIITGEVKTPTNSAVQYAWIDARGNKGMGNGSTTDNNGRFSIKVPAGTYSINVFSNLETFGSPDPKSVTVSADETADAGTLYLKAKNCTIKGFVQDDDGNAVSNVIVNAWLSGGAGWAMDATDQTGAYTLTVVAGAWGVMAMPMSQNYIYTGAPKQIAVAANETSQDNNFELKIANKTLKVRVKKLVGSEYQVAEDLWGGVWVRDTSAGMLDFGGPMEDMMQKAGMMSSGGGAAAGGGPQGAGMEKGGFAGGGLSNGYTEIKVPAGGYEVGLGLPPGSNYTLAQTATITVAGADTIKEVNLIVKENNATISGHFYLDANNNDSYDSGEAVTGLRAFINADRDGGGWQSTESNTDGSYTLNVAEGEWFVDAFIDPWMMFGSNQYLVINEDVKITVADGGSGTNDFPVKLRDAVISGTVWFDEDGSATRIASEGMAGVWVFADFGSAAMIDEFKGPGGPGLGAFTAADGSYELAVPAGTYKIGAGIPPWDTRDLLNPDLTTVVAVANQTASGNNLEFKASNATISGTMYLDADSDGAVDAGEAKAGFIRAWSDQGGGVGAISLDGSYSLKVTQDDTWHIAASSEISNLYYESDESDILTTIATNGCSVSGNSLSCAGKNLALVSQNFIVPDGISSSFDSSQSKSLHLTKMEDVDSDGDLESQDEVVIEVPAGAIDTSGTITVSITPTVNVKPDAKDKPIGLSYDFEARDANGTEIEDFTQDVTIYMHYDADLITAAGYSEESITPKYYDTSTGSWENYSNVVRDTKNDQFIIKTAHFSSGGLTGIGNIPTAPSSLTATAQSASSIALAWADNSNDETGFKIYRGSSLIATAAANAVSYANTGLSANTAYSYTVKSTNSSGDSSASNTASATTLSNSSSSGSVILPSQSQQSAPEKPTAKQPSPVAEKISAPNSAQTSRLSQLERIISEAKSIAKTAVAEIVKLVKTNRDLAKEQTWAKFTAEKIIGALTANKETKSALVNFITYGTPESLKLGSGERAGVVNSFKSAFGKLPQTETDWQDVIKIGAGRWPSQKSEIKEKMALKTFEKIYKHQANRQNPKEDAAVVIMAYGLRPSARNLASEKPAIQTFKKIFNKQPTTANDWDIARAIAYSGASRKSTGQVLGASIKKASVSADTEVYLDREN